MLYRVKYGDTMVSDEPVVIIEAWPNAPTDRYGFELRMTRLDAMRLVLDLETILSEAVQ